MNILVTEDDFVCRNILAKYLSDLGNIDIAVDGAEAITAVETSLKSDHPYQLICLDIMMPQINGQKALAKIRQLESEYNVPIDNAAIIIMTTALSDIKNVMNAYSELADGYVVKPIRKEKLFSELAKLKLTTAV